jgi:CBS domain-containing protein
LPLLRKNLRRLTIIAKQILQPRLLIPTFAAEVLCFSPEEHLADALRYMRKTDFSQIVIKQDDRKLRLLTVEGITKWLAEEVDGYHIAASRTTLGHALGREHPGCFLVMSPNQTVFDAADAFKNSVHRETTRLYAIIVTDNGNDAGLPIGFVTLWDLVHSPRLQESFSDLASDSLPD